MSLKRDLLKAKRYEMELKAAPSAPVSRPAARRASNAGASPGLPTPHREAVHVAVRVRPPSAIEGDRDVIVSMDPSRNAVFVKDKIEGQKMFAVDMPIWSCSGKAIDGSDAVTQAALYRKIGRPLLHHALDGFNSTLMAYGQTGSGKTYTMMGDPGAIVVDDNEDVFNESEEGIVPRLCRDMFQEINNRSVTSSSDETMSWEVHISFVEVYCEKITDLLNHNAPVSLRDETVGNETYFSLVGARRVLVKDTVSTLQAIKTGDKCRKKYSTSLNERSSRSHAIFIIELTEILSFTDPEGEVASAPSKNLTIRLVDLAGSERVGEAGLLGQQFKEGVDINLSLFALGMVIESLSDPKRRNIKPPYRDSILTKLLKDAFGGNSKTTMICTIAPTELYRSCTLQTLQYGSKTRCVMNEPQVKIDPSAAALRVANEELITLRKQLLESKQGSKQRQNLIHQLAKANERLRQEQAVSRRCKAIIDAKEEELAAHFRKMEAEREEHGTRMREMGERVQKAEYDRERQEKKATRQWEQKMNTLHKREMQAERREKELQKMQRELEERVAKRETQVKRKEDELDEKLKEMEERASREKCATQRLQADLRRAVNAAQSNNNNNNNNNNNKACSNEEGEEGGKQEEANLDGRNTKNMNRRYAELKNMFDEREALLRQKEEEFSAKEREFNKQKQKWNEDHLVTPYTSGHAIADVFLEARARSEAATMLEAELKNRLALIDGDTENLATCLRLGEEALQRRELWCVDSSEGHERVVLKLQEEGEMRLIKRQMQMEEEEIRIHRQKVKLEHRQQKNAHKHKEWSRWTQKFFFAMETHCRGVLVSSWKRQHEFMKELEYSTRTPHQNIVRREAANHAQNTNALEKLRAQLDQREEGLIEEEKRLEERIASLELLERQREKQFLLKDEEIKMYLLELEALDREKMDEFRRKEEELAAAHEKLCKRELALGGHMKNAQRMLMERTAVQMSDNLRTQEEGERDHIERMCRLQNELSLCRGAANGNRGSAHKLLELKEIALREEEERLSRRIARLQSDEAQWKKRVAAEENEIRLYLLSLEEEDVRRVKLSEEGANYLRKVELNQEELRKREKALEELSCRLQKEAAERERGIQQMEEQLRKQQAELEKHMQERTADIERRRCEAVTAAEDNERTLMDQEADLMEAIAKNEEVRRQIEQRDAELKEQRRNYIDLRKLLEDYERLLLREHAHRMNGKESATQLTDDLLDVNELLKRQLAVWIQKYKVLKTDEKVECERCLWQNVRDATVCRCCGNTQLV